MTTEEFIKIIEPLVEKWAKQYDIKVISPILGQAILESQSGNSELAVNAFNFFGLKYNSRQPNRCPGNIGYYVKEGSEQNFDGSYTRSAMLWQKFADYDQGVKGYFDFINTANYACLKGETDPYQYLVKIKACKYATSLNYVANVYNVVTKYNLTQYDARGDQTNKKPLDENIKIRYSPLVSYYREAAHHGGQRSHDIDTITIHCYVGQVTAKQGVDYFATLDRDASSNYVVGYDGSVGCSVPEDCRSFCSSDRPNDQRAITIEVACERTHPYTVKQAALMKTIELIADVCRRNKIKQLKWSDSKYDRMNHVNGCNMTVHRDFKPSKACPGDYLMACMPFIQDAVNDALK